MNINDFQKKKANLEKITMITCYDYTSACLVDKSNIDCILVGDSAAMVMHGFKDTTHATVDMMTTHTNAVSRGARSKFIITDMPFLSHRKSQHHTIDVVQSLLKSGAQALKIEGGDPKTCEVITFLTHAGVPIMGHIGLMPQMIHQLGSYKVQGRNKSEAQRLIHQALQLQSAGAFAIVLECVPESVAKEISKALEIPVIGIGAGKNTDGQVLVWQDILGLGGMQSLKFVKSYANLDTIIIDGLNTYCQEVHTSVFPTKTHSFI